MVRMSCEDITTLVSQGQFPAPKRLPTGVLVWRYLDIVRWVDSLDNQRTWSGEAPVSPYIERVEDITRDCAEKIMQVLRAVEPGKRIRGKEIATIIGDGCDHTSGSFKRAIRELKRQGSIDSTLEGYSLVWPKSGQSLASPENLEEN